MKFGVIVGSRGFFPGHLASLGREQMLAALGTRAAVYQSVRRHLGRDMSRHAG